MRSYAFKSRRESAWRAGVRQTLKICLCALLWFCAFQSPVIAQSSDSTSVHLNDAGLQFGRYTQGVSVPPAAFSGTERPDTASFRMNIPLVNIPGRGLNLDLALHYDSSLYQLTWTGQNSLVDFTALHPQNPAYGFQLGFGMLVSHNAILDCHNFQSGSCFPSAESCPFFNGGVEVARATTFIDQSGARHRIEKGISVDGSDLRSRPENGIPTITFPDGTKVFFGNSRNIVMGFFTAGSFAICNGQASCTTQCSVSDTVYFPTKVVDRNGNFIQITYLSGGGPRINTITDTLGRTISFRYDGAGRLQSIAVRGFTPNTEREVARFYYHVMTRVHDFADQPDHSQQILVLDRIFLPGTKTGWFFQYSSYGQIYSVEKLGGMDVDTASGAIVNFGQRLALTEYDYNGTPLNPTTNMLFQLPKYTRRTDEWLGNTAGQVTHQFNVNYVDSENKSYSLITAPDGTTSEIQKRWYHAIKHHKIGWAQTWDEGLVLQAKVEKLGKTYVKVVNDWVHTDGGPRLLSQASTNDAGEQTRVEYTYYDPTSTTVNNVTTYNGVFSNVKDIKEFGFLGQQLKRTEYTYETNTPWTNRWLLKLQKTVKTFEGQSITPASQVDYAYDEVALTSYPTLPVTYDTNIPSERGNLTSVTVNTNAANPSQGINIVTRTSYDVFGNPVESVDGIGNATPNPADHITRTEYSEAFQFAYPTRTVSAVPDETGLKGSAASLITSSDYNFNTGLVVSTTDANGQITSSTYTSPDDPPNALDRIRIVRYPDGGETSYEYSDAPSNSFVRTSTLRHSSPGFHEFEFHVLDKYEYFDALGRASRTYINDGTPSTPWIATQTIYDVFGRVERTSNEMRVQNRGDDISTNDWTVTSFDSLSRPLTVTTPDGAKVYTAYLGSKTMVTDQAGKSRRRETDALGRLVQVVEFTHVITDATQVQAPTASDYLTSYEYDILDNLTKVRQGEVFGQGCSPVCQERVFTYDSLSRRTSIRSPERGLETFKYDHNSNLTERIDARNLRSSFEYDGLDRQIRRTYNVVGGGALPLGASLTPTVDLFYDGKGIPQTVPVPANSAGPLGRMTAVKSSVSESIYSGFDAMGRVIASAQVTGADGQTAPQTYLMSYEYDQTGNLKAQTYPSGRKITHEFDLGGRLKGVKGLKAGSSLTTDYAQFITYNPAGKIASFKYGNGLWEHIKYNSRSQAFEIGLSSTSDQSGNKLKLAYQYGALIGGTLDPTKNNGNIQSQTISFASADGQPSLNLKQDYEYDQLNRVRMAMETNGASWRQTFDYDKFGNREIILEGTTDSIEKPSLGLSSANNRITAAGYSYDNAGNLISEPGHSYKYDAQNRMSSHSDIHSYTYDGDGRRVRKSSSGSTTVFVYDAVGKLVAEYASQTSTGGTSYLTPDHLNNTRVVSNSTGTVTSRHDYLPFGEELDPHLLSSGRQNVASYNPGNIKQKYASKERDDETGLDYFGTRYFSSSQGRFTSPDASLVDQFRENPQSWNLYSYTRNNPIRVADKNGEITPWDVADAVSLVMSIYEFYEEPTLANGAWLVGDLVGTLLPIVPFGSIRRGYEAVDMAADLFSVARTIERADDIGDFARFSSRGSSAVDDGFTTFYNATRKGPGAALTKVDTENVTETVYRGLAAGEDPATGLLARAPDAGNNVASHVAGKRASQWISTTKSLDVAKSKFGEYGVVAIDLSKTETTVVDISKGIPGLPRNAMLSNWSRKTKEVLILNRIPARAITVIR